MVWHFVRHPEHCMMQKLRFWISQQASHIITNMLSSDENVYFINGNELRVRIAGRLCSYFFLYFVFIAYLMTLSIDDIIQGDSGGNCNTFGNDSMCDSKQKSSYEHVSDFRGILGNLEGVLLLGLLRDRWRRALETEHLLLYCGTEEKSSVHVRCEWEVLISSLRHAYLGSFLLDPEDIMNISVGVIQGSFNPGSEYGEQRACFKA